MSVGTDELVTHFRKLLEDCRRLYVRAARASLEDRSDADESVRRDMVRRMVDLHKGLLIKIYATIAQADRRWSRTEQQLACELVDHLWQQRLQGPQLKDVTRRMFKDAAYLKWYGLIRPFDRITSIRDLAPTLETIVMRVANLIAKADGTVTTDEANALRSMQHEIEVHLTRLTLDEHSADEDDERRSQATRIVHKEATLLAGAKRKEAPEVGREDPNKTAADEFPDSLDKALEDLNRLIGLDQVKKEIDTLTNYLHLQQYRRAAGLPAHELSLHMVFKGNPGTGKTTVARIVGRILKTLGLLKKGHLVETDRSGLVAEYAGQTGPKANRKIDEALDGILFVDEAYSLVAANEKDAYGQEAIQALVKRMEDDRNRLVVILAGYPDPMDELLRSNPGLSSRFNTQMQFEDYSPIDLGRIYQRMCEANHYEIPGPARRDCCWDSSGCTNTATNTSATADWCAIHSKTRSVVWQIEWPRWPP